MILPKVSYHAVGGNGVRIATSVDGREVGHCYLYVLRNDLHTRPFGFLEDIFVETHARRMGIARRLALEAIEVGWQLGCYKIIATSRFEHEDQHRRTLTYGYKKWGYEFRIDAPHDHGSADRDEPRTVGGEEPIRGPRRVIVPTGPAGVADNPGFEQYVQSLSRKILAAGVVVTDESDRVLLVQPSYKADWEIPGGTVEENETPWDAALRECQEELGLALALGRLLVVDFAPGDHSRPESLKFVFDGGVLSSNIAGCLTLPADEVLAAGFFARTELKARVADELAARIDAALDARGDTETVLCWAGSPVTGPTSRSG